MSLKKWKVYLWKPQVQRRKSKLSVFPSLRHKRSVKVWVWSFVTAALNWMGGQRHTLAALTPGIKTTVPVCKEAGWTLELVWTLCRLTVKFTALKRQRVFHKKF
jgi:hypothetical protein